MLITNKIFDNLNLANSDERGENFIFDFFISSIIPLIIIYFTHSNILVSILIYYFFRFIYYFSFEYFFGRTLGKYKTQTITVNIDNEKPTITQLIIRNLTRFISLISAVGDDEIAIHDKISNTFVVKNENLKNIPEKLSKYFRIIFTPFYLYFIYNYLNTNTDLNNLQVIGILVLILVYIFFPKSLFKKMIERNRKA